MAKSPPVRGLSAILATAAPIEGDLEREMQSLIAERQRNVRDLDARIPTATLEVAHAPPVPMPQPLSEEAKLLISKGIVMAAEQLAEEAKQAVTKYVEDAEALHAEVSRWSDTLVRNAKQTAAEVAERHAGLLRSRPLFHQAMNGDEQALPSPVPTPAKEGNGAAA